MAGFGKFN